jgi:hypothetical protein
MPHYVNIAWGIIFWSCLFVCRGSAALWILLFTLKIIHYQKAKDNVPHEHRHKKHDKK